MSPAAEYQEAIRILEPVEAKLVSFVPPPRSSFCNAQVANKSSSRGTHICQAHDCGTFNCGCYRPECTHCEVRSEPGPIPSPIVHPVRLPVSPTLLSDNAWRTQSNAQVSKYVPMHQHNTECFDMILKHEVCGSGGGYGYGYGGGGYSGGGS